MISIVSFVISNLRWLLPILGIAALFVSAWKYVNDVKNDAYEKGIADEKARFEQIIAAEDAKNREFEAMLQNAITEYGTKAVEEAAKRVKKETVHTRTIETIVRDNPIYAECKAEPQVLEHRNIIRSLGPLLK